MAEPTSVTPTKLTNEKPIAMHLKAGTADGLLLAANQIADLARSMADDTGTITTKTTVQDTLDAILTSLAQKMNQSYMQQYTQAEWYKLTNYEQDYSKVPDGIVYVYDVTTPTPSPVTTGGVTYSNGVITFSSAYEFEGGVLALTSQDSFSNNTLTLRKSSSEEEEYKSSFVKSTGYLTFASDTSREATTGYITLGSSVTRDSTGEVVTVNGTAS